MIDHVQDWWWHCLPLHHSRLCYQWNNVCNILTKCTKAFCRHFFFCFFRKANSISIYLHASFVTLFMIIPLRLARSRIVYIEVQFIFVFWEKILLKQTFIILCTYETTMLLDCTRQTQIKKKLLEGLTVKKNVEDVLYWWWYDIDESINQYMRYKQTNNGRHWIISMIRMIVQWTVCNVWM